MTEFPFAESLDDDELDVAAIAELLGCSLERAHRLLDSLDALYDHLDDIPRHLPLTAHHVWDPWEGRYFELQHRIVTLIQALPRGS